MLVGFRTINRLRSSKNTFWIVSNPRFSQRFNFSQNLILGMGTEAPPKRPFCPSCSKPARLCLCSRFKTQLINNSIAVTILQHNHERNHPLNSTRIATLGLKNLTVATVSDVHFEAQFHIRLLKPDSETWQVLEQNKDQNFAENQDFDRNLRSQVLQKPVYEVDLKAPNVGSNLRNGCVDSVTNAEISQNNEKKSDFERILRYPEKKNSVEQDRANVVNVGEERISALLKSNDLVLEVEHESMSKRGSIQKQLEESAKEMVSNTQTVSIDDNQVPKPVFVQMESNPIGEEEEPFITATIAKCGFTCSLTHLRTRQNDLENPSFDQLLASQVGQDAISNGFIVKKLQRKQLVGSMEFEEYKEYEIVVPPGSALLFPTKKSIGLEDVNFLVKHLIVLDGTWDKAKRMYHENPWLKLLPHLKLDPNKSSLYSEVRHQPKIGCVSTIESVVCALKAYGDDCEGLDDLLDVFKSMVEDQRRCKDERLSKISPA